MYLILSRISFTKLYLPLGGLTLLFLSFSVPENDKWELKKHQNGIAIYTRLAENSKFKELKCVIWNCLAH